MKIKSIELSAIGKALLFSCILCVLLATIIYFTGLKETLLPSLGKIILTVSVFFASAQVSHYHGNKGLVRGVTIGVIFFIIVVILSLVFNKTIVSFGTFFYSLAVCVIAGGLGGILGIGLSHS